MTPQAVLGEEEDVVVVVAVVLEMVVLVVCAEFWSCRISLTRSMGAVTVLAKAPDRAPAAASLPAVAAQDGVGAGDGDVDDVDDDNDDGWVILTDLLEIPCDEEGANIPLGRNSGGDESTFIFWELGRSS